MKFKLVLFDIDGTLIYYVKSLRYEDQYEYAMKQVFGIDVSFDLAKFNGTVDRQNSWEIVREFGISRKEFLQKFPVYVDAMREFIGKRGGNQVLFMPIPSALTFVRKLSAESIPLGVITGNAKSIAVWKLEHTNLSKYFHFGLYGDEADNRDELASLVFEKAKRELHVSLDPKDIVVVGDSVYDIRCGKAIGAVTVCVLTGAHTKREALESEKPDYLIDSLLDPTILSLFSLQ